MPSRLRTPLPCLGNHPHAYGPFGTHAFHEGQRRCRSRPRATWGRSRQRSPTAPVTRIRRIHLLRMRVSGVHPQSTTKAAYRLANLGRRHERHQQLLTSS
jgi:hypothetical protein